MGLSTILVCVQTVIGLISLIVSLFALTKANNVERIIKNGGHNKNNIKRKNKQVAIGKRNEQKINNKI